MQEHPLKAFYSYIKTTRLPLLQALTNCYKDAEETQFSPPHLPHSLGIFWMC